MKIYIKYIIVCFLFILSCQEELPLESQGFESVLVVEATITNKLKHQEVKLSRTFLLEDSEQILENNAEVKVVDDTGNSYTFSQNAEGIYISDIAFEAEDNKTYNLQIITSSDEAYTSKNTQLTPISQIDNLYAEYVDDEVKGPGVQIFIDSQNTGTEAQYFKYEWEETYKLVAPFNNINEGVIFSNFFETPDPECGSKAFYDVNFFDIIQEEATCYNSNKNTNIIQASANNLTENVISRQSIRFIPEENDTDSLDISMLRDRYSIKVKQYVQSVEAYTYYKITSQFGNNESILSEDQPGFVQGNLTSLDNTSERVIGYFEVASVSEKRIFFNHEDLNIPFPNYLYECDSRILNLGDNTTCDGDLNEKKELYTLVTRENYKLSYYTSGGIFAIARQKCVICTSAGTNIQPDFWIE